MYAVIRAGGKQYRVAPGDVIKLESFASSDKDGNVEFAQGDILAVSSEAGKITTGGSGASVSGQIVDEGRGKKILVFHYKRKKQYKKLQGHRQGYTAVRITEISFDGQKVTAPAIAARKPKAKTDIASKIAGAVGTTAGVVAGVADAVKGKKPTAKKKAVAKKAAPKKK